MKAISFKNDSDKYMILWPDKRCRNMTWAHFIPAKGCFYLDVKQEWIDIAKYVIQLSDGIRRYPIQDWERLKLTYETR